MIAAETGALLPVWLLKTKKSVMSLYLNFSPFVTVSATGIALHSLPLFAYDCCLRASLTCIVFITCWWNDRTGWLLLALTAYVSLSSHKNVCATKLKYACRKRHSAEASPLDGQILFATRINATNVTKFSTLVVYLTSLSPEATAVWSEQLLFATQLAQLEKRE